MVGAARRVIKRLIELTLDREGKAEEAVGQFVLAAKVTQMPLLLLSEREGALSAAGHRVVERDRTTSPRKTGQYISDFSLAFELWLPYQRQRAAHGAVNQP